MVASPKTGSLDVGRRIAVRREELGLSRRALAEETGLSYPYIAQIETGYRMPTARHQVSLARALGTTLDDLFGATVDEPAVSPGDRKQWEQGRRITTDEAVTRAVEALGSLPVSVRLEALAQVQLQIMTQVTQENSRRG